MTIWAVGDKAVYVTSLPMCGECNEEGFEEKWPGILTVCRVKPFFGHKFPGLDFIEYPAGVGCWCACRVRKVVIDKHEACEEEFVTLLKRVKPKVGV